MRSSLAVLSVLLATRAFAFAPAEIVHDMVGRMLLSSGYGAGVVSMRVNCVFYEGGPICRGSWHCRAAPADRGTPICDRARGRAQLEMDDAARADHLSHDAGVSVFFPDGAECAFRGTVPFSFGAIPAVSGEYACHDAAGTLIEQGLFGFRARSIGKWIYRYD